MKQRESKKSKSATIIAVVTFLASLAAIIALLFQWQQTKTELAAVEEARRNVEADVNQKETALVIAIEQRNLQGTMVASGGNMVALQATLIELNRQQSTVAPNLPTVPIPPASTPSFPTSTIAAAITPTPLLIPTNGQGPEKVILSNGEDNTYNWQQGSPYLTRQFVDEGDVAFIPTGNNNFSTELGVIGYEQGEFRYITFKLYLLKQEAALLLQAQTSITGWEHRWGFDGRSAFQGYRWARKGQNTNLPVGEWFDVKIDLIDQLGVKPGEKLIGLAFSGNDGNIIFDWVTLVSDH
jgi:hypothetical protein